MHHPIQSIRTHPTALAIWKMSITDWTSPITDVQRNSVHSIPRSFSCFNQHHLTTPPTFTWLLARIGNSAVVLGFYSTSSHLCGSTSCGSSVGEHVYKSNCHMAGKLSWQKDRRHYSFDIENKQYDQ